jgi:signal transduction histidine kinase/CheY-like chemotaxis protein
MKKNRLRLRGKFLVYVILLISLLMGGTLFVVERNDKKVILSEGKKRGLSNALYLAALSTSHLLVYDYTKLEQNVDEVAKEPDIVYAMILDKNGSIIAHSNREDLIGKVLSDPVSTRAWKSSTQLIQEYHDPDLESDIWDIAYPIHQGGVRWGMVRIGFSHRNLIVEIERNRQDLIVLFLVVLVFAVLAAVVLAERISGPVRKLSVGALSISKGDLNQKIDIHTGDEIEELSDTFNRMTGELAKNRDQQKQLIDQLSGKNVLLQREIAAREKLEAEIIKIERLRALGEMSSGVAHDFNNILGAILGRAQLLLEKTKNQHTKKSLEIIEKAALDGAETVRRIQEFTRVRVDSRLFIEVDVNELVNDVIEFTRTRWKNEALARGVQISIVKEFGEIPVMMGDPSGLREVFTNLIINSVDAMPDGGTITVHTYRNGDRAIITVSDDGLGMSADIQQRIFEPFFTTKGKSGNGLGLSMCYGIVSRHQGEINVSSVPGKGTTFTVSLPTTLAGDVKERAPNMKNVLFSAKVLVIDDDEQMRTVLCDILQNSKCEVEQAGSGTEGLLLFSNGSFDIVLSDLGMEGVTGWEVAQKVKEASPETTVALITGWGTQLDDEEVRRRGVDFVVSKPFRIKEVQQLVSQAMALKHTGNQ